MGRSSRSVHLPEVQVLLIVDRLAAKLEASPRGRHLRLQFAQALCAEFLGSWFHGFRGQDFVSAAPYHQRQQTQSQRTARSWLAVFSCQSGSTFSCCCSQEPGSAQQQLISLNAAARAKTFGQGVKAHHVEALDV